MQPSIEQTTKRRDSKGSDWFDPDSFEAGVKLMTKVIGNDVDQKVIRQHLNDANGNPEIALNNYFALKRPSSPSSSPKSSPRTNRNNNNSNSHLVISETYSTDSPLSQSSEQTSDLQTMISECAKCFACRQFYSDPVAIPCGHSFCRNCLQVTENQIECIICNSKCENSVNNVKTNVFLTNIVDMITLKIQYRIQANPSVSSTLCGECDQAESVTFCCDCSEFLCLSCHNKVHSFRLTSHHKYMFTDYEALEEFKKHQDHGAVVIPSVKVTECEELFAAWAKKLWWAPSDLASHSILSEPKLIFLACYLFNVDINATFSCMIPNNNTRDIHLPPSKYYNSATCKNIPVLVFGCSDFPEQVSLPELEPWRLQPAELVNSIATFADRVRMDYSYGYGLDKSHTESTGQGEELPKKVPVEIHTFNIEPDQAWRTPNNLKKLDALIRDACTKTIQNGHHSTFSNLQILSTIVNKSITQRIFVPLYSCPFTYQSETFQFFINASNGICHGDRPFSILRMPAMVSNTTNLLTRGFTNLFSRRIQ